jgi:glycosyltransferase involved in cell wall biosynthesis
VSFNKEMIENLKVKLVELPYQIIKQSIEITTSSTYSIRELLKIPKDAYVTLFPSGIRKVKDPTFVLKQLLELLEENPNDYIVLIGAKLDKKLEQEIKEMVKGYERFYILDVINHADFASVIKESDLIINTSISEGMSNVIMEGMYLGIPIIARENEGNLKLIQHKNNGLIFRTPDEFKTMYYLLKGDINLRNLLINNAKAMIREEYCIEKEACLYKQLLEETFTNYYYEYKGLKLYFPEKVHPFSTENNDLFEVYLQLFIAFNIERIF